MSEQAQHSPSPIEGLHGPMLRDVIKPEQLKGGNAVLDPGLGDLCDPGEIGMTSITDQGEAVHVLGEAGMTDGNPYTNDEFAVIMLDAGKEGGKRFVLSGLTADESGRKHLTDKWLELEDGKTVSFGRLGELPDGHEGKPENTYGKASLWPNGTFEGSGYSRNHLSVTLKDGKVEVQDTSTFGSTIKRPEQQEPSRLRISMGDKNNTSDKQDENLPNPYSVPESTAVVEATQEQWEAARDSRAEAVGKVAEDAGDVAVEQVIEAPADPQVMHDELVQVSDAVATEVSADGQPVLSESKANQVQESESTAADVVDEPTQPELLRPKTEDIFATTESLDATLANQDVDPDLKQEVRQLVGLWKDVQTSVAGNEFWQEIAGPKITDVVKAAQAFSKEAGNLAGDLQRLKTTMDNVASALEQNGVTGLAQQGIRLRNIEDVVGKLTNLNRMQATNQLFSAVDELDVAVIEKDERFRAAARTDKITDEAELGRLAELVKQNDGDLKAARQALQGEQHNQDQMRAWKPRKEAIETVVHFAKLAVRDDPANVSSPIRRLVNELEGMLSLERSQNSYDVAHIRQVSTQRVTQILDEYRGVDRIAKLSVAYSEDAQR